MSSVEAMTQHHHSLFAINKLGDSRSISLPEELLRAIHDVTPILSTDNTKIVVISSFLSRESSSEPGLVIALSITQTCLALHSSRAGDTRVEGLAGSS
jgi:hypothetical protein